MIGKDIYSCNSNKIQRIRRRAENLEGGAISNLNSVALLYIAISYCNSIFICLPLSSAQSNCAENYWSYDFENSEGPCWIKECSDSNLEWIWDLSEGHESNRSLKSADLGGYDRKAKVSSICREVTGPADIFFWWKQYNTPRGYGKLTFLVNGKEKPLQSTDNWAQQAYSLPENQTYTVEWRFARILGLNKGAGWIDDLNISRVSFNRTASNEPSFAYLSPSDNDIRIINSKNQTASVNFTFMPIINKGVAESILHIYKEQELIQTEKLPSRMGDLYYFQCQISGPGSYSWNIEIMDVEGQRNKSKNRTLEVIRDEIPEIPLINLPREAYIDTTMSFQKEKYELKNIEFQYIPCDDNGIKECSLFIYKDNILTDSNKSYNVLNHEINKFNSDFTKPGNYTLKLFCVDFSNQKSSIEGNFLINSRLIVNSEDNLSNAFSRASSEKIKYIKLKNGSFSLIGGIEIAEPFLNISGDHNGDSLIYGSGNKITEINIESANCSISNIKFNNISIRLLGNNCTIYKDNFYNINYIGILVSNATGIRAESNNFSSKNVKGPSFGIVVFGSQGINVIKNNFSDDILEHAQYHVEIDSNRANIVKL